ncbi:LysR family transcriptional regulator [Afipia felis]
MPPLDCATTAQELNVTQTAVSHSVRVLRQHLGYVPLKRHSN